MCRCLKLYSGLMCDALVMPELVWRVSPLVHSSSSECDQSACGLVTVALSLVTECDR